MQQDVFTLNFEPFKRNAVSIFPLGGSNDRVFHLRIINFRGRGCLLYTFSQAGRLLTLHLVPYSLPCEGMWKVYEFIINNFKTAHALLKYTFFYHL